MCILFLLQLNGHTGKLTKKEEYIFCSIFEITTKVWGMGKTFPKHL